MSEYPLGTSTELASSRERLVGEYVRSVKTNRRGAQERTFRQLSDFAIAAHNVDSFGAQWATLRRHLVAIPEAQACLAVDVCETIDNDCSPAEMSDAYVNLATSYGPSACTSDTVRGVMQDYATRSLQFPEGDDYGQAELAGQSQVLTEHLQLSVNAARRLLRSWLGRNALETLSARELQIFAEAVEATGARDVAQALMHEAKSLREGTDDARAQEAVALKEQIRQEYEVWMTGLQPQLVPFRAYKQQEYELQQEITAVQELRRELQVWDAALRGESMDTVIGFTRSYMDNYLERSRDLYQNNPEAFGAIADLRQDPVVLHEIAEQQVRAQIIALAPTPSNGLETRDAYMDRLRTLPTESLSYEISQWRAQLTSEISGLEKELATLRAKHVGTEQEISEAITRERALADQFITASLVEQGLSTTTHNVELSAMVERSQTELLTLRTRDAASSLYVTPQLNADDHSAFARALLLFAQGKAAALQYEHASELANTQVEQVLYQLKATQARGGGLMSVKQHERTIETLRAQTLPGGPANSIPPNVISQSGGALPVGSNVAMALLEPTYFLAQYHELLRSPAATEKDFLALEEKFVAYQLERRTQATAVELAEFGKITELILQRYLSPGGKVFTTLLSGDAVWAERHQDFVDANPVAMQQTHGESEQEWFSAAADSWDSYHWWFDSDAEWIDDARRAHVPHQIALNMIAHCRNVLTTFEETIQPFTRPDKDDPLSDRALRMQGMIAFHGNASGLNLPLDGLEALARLEEQYPYSAGLNEFKRELKTLRDHLIRGGEVVREFTTQDFNYDAYYHSNLLMQGDARVRDDAHFESQLYGMGAGVGGCVLTGGLCVVGGVLAGAGTETALYPSILFEAADNTRQCEQTELTGYSAVPNTVELRSSLHAAVESDVRWAAGRGAMNGLMASSIYTVGRFMVAGMPGQVGAMAAEGGRQELGGLTGLVLNSARGVGSMAYYVATSSPRQMMAHMAQSAGRIGGNVLQSPRNNILNLQWWRQTGSAMRDSALGRFFLGSRSSLPPLPEGMQHSLSTRMARFMFRLKRDPVSGGWLWRHPENGQMYVWNARQSTFMRWEGAEILSAEAAAALRASAQTTAAGETIYLNAAGRPYIYLANNGAGKAGYVPLSTSPVAGGAAEALTPAAVEGVRANLRAGYGAFMTHGENISPTLISAGWALPRGDKEAFEFGNFEGFFMYMYATRFGINRFDINAGGQRLVFWMDRGADLYLQKFSGLPFDELDYTLGAIQYWSGSIPGQARGNAIIRMLALRRERTMNRAAVGLSAASVNPFRYVSSFRLSFTRATQVGNAVRDEAVASAKLLPNAADDILDGMSPTLRQRVRESMGRAFGAKPGRAMTADERSMLAALYDESNFNGVIRISRDGRLIRRGFGRTVAGREAVDTGKSLSADEQAVLARVFYGDAPNRGFAQMFGKGQQTIDLRVKPILNKKGMALFHFYHEMLIGPFNEGLRYAILMDGDFQNTFNWTAIRAVTTLPAQSAWKVATGWDTKPAAWIRPFTRNGLDIYLTRALPLWEGKGFFAYGYRELANDWRGHEDVFDTHFGPGILDSGGVVRHDLLAQLAGGKNDPEYRQIGSEHANLAKFWLERPIRGKTHSKYFLSDQELANVENHFDGIFDHVVANPKGKPLLEDNGELVDYLDVDVRRQALAWALVADYVNQEAPSRMSKVTTNHTHLIEVARAATGLPREGTFDIDQLDEAIDRIGRGDADIIVTDHEQVSTTHQ